MALEDHYSGDDAFDRLARVHEPQFEAAWEAWPHRAPLIEACDGDALLAKVIYRVAGDGALAYLDERPAVLEGLSPRECLGSRKGLRRLKEALLRFPYM